MSYYERFGRVNTVPVTSVDTFTGKYLLTVMKPISFGVRSSGTQQSLIKAFEVAGE